MGSLEEARRSYADELRSIARVGSEAVIEAFATVPREHFLGPGPWQIHGEPDLAQSTTPDADPRHVYRNVLVVLDPERHLNNGAPSLWARLFDAVRPAQGERVVHVGAGTGYYSAILAELVGPTGHVTALEIRPELASRAQRNLEPWPWVEARAADGTEVDPGPSDLIVINAGATHPAPLWLERLEPGGRLLLPLTVRGLPNLGLGGVLRVERGHEGFGARFVTQVGIYHCEGARDREHERRLAGAFGRGMSAALAVRSLRRDEHAEDDTCWLHCDAFCLSSCELESAPGE